jgi:hypothetical protein
MAQLVDTRQHLTGDMLTPVVIHDRDAVRVFGGEPPEVNAHHTSSVVSGVRP